MPPTFLPYQQRWINDQSPLKIMEKSRQIGISYATAYSAVLRASRPDARFDIFVSSRDETQARLFLEDCLQFSRQYRLRARSVAHPNGHVLYFPNGRRIYSLTSNPNALAGKHGHVILDEFALHEDQRLLYRVAKPVTTWGGQLEIISTHRGLDSLFAILIRDLTERDNPMGWSHHRVTIQDAASQGLVQSINAKSRRSETAEAFLQRTRRECVDEEQWCQEYCCKPTSCEQAFLSGDLIARAETPDVLQSWEQLEAHTKENLYAGVDIGRKRDLTVIDLGEFDGHVMHDRLRIELRDTPFSDQEKQLRQILRLPGIMCASIDATGIGTQFAEKFLWEFGWKIQSVIFTPPLREQLAFQLRSAFEDGNIRINPDPALRTDLRSLRKIVTPGGTIRLQGDSPDGHCDRFWAMALRQHSLNVHPVNGLLGFVGD